MVFQPSLQRLLPIDFDLLAAPLLEGDAGFRFVLRPRAVEATHRHSEHASVLKDVLVVGLRGRRANEFFLFLFAINFLVEMGNVFV